MKLRLQVGSTPQGVQRGLTSKESTPGVVGDAFGHALVQHLLDGFRQREGLLGICGGSIPSVMLRDRQKVSPVVLPTQKGSGPSHVVS